MVGRGVRDKRIAATILTLVVLLTVLAIVSVPRPSSAEVFPKLVRGHVYDSMGVPIVGANVTVVTKDTLGTPVHTEYDDATDSSGLYEVTVDGAFWNPGYTIEVTARYASDSSTNSTVADSSPLQYIDVTLSLVIPEFGPLTVPLIVGISILFMAAFISFRKNTRNCA